jgi:hypothetical protein
MKFLSNIGAKLGTDDGFVGGDGKPGFGGVMTKDQAVARKAELNADKTWIGKFAAGDAQARREMERLNQIIAGSA